MHGKKYLIDHSKTLKTQHLIGHKLHLNRRGAPVLQNTVCKFLSKIFNCCFEENSVEIATVTSTALQSDKECLKSKANQMANTENSNMDLKTLCLKNFNKPIIAHLNMNSLRNKFEFLISLIKSNIDVFMISKTKLDESFPTSQFMINGFSPPFRLDRYDEAGGIILYIREDIPSRLISTEFSQVEGFFVEINLQNKKNKLSSFFREFMCNRDRAIRLS